MVPSPLALCDDVTFFPLPQGGYWGFKSPTRHPWHPHVPLPSIPRWGNRQWGCGGGCYQLRLSTLTRRLPRPLFSHLSAVANSPLTHTFWMQHGAHSLHPSSQCTFKRHQSVPTFLISTVNQHRVNWKISQWFLPFKENHQTGTPTFTLKDDVNSIITYFLMPFWLTA